MKIFDSYDIIDNLTKKFLAEGIDTLPMEPKESEVEKFMIAFRKIQDEFEQQLVIDIKKALSLDEIHLIDTRIFLVDPQKQGSTYVLTKAVLPNDMYVHVECILFINRIILSYRDRSIFNNLNGFWSKRKLKSFDFNGDIFFKELKKL